MSKQTDIDIDVKSRDDVLRYVKHVPALGLDRASKHNVGVYFQNIPENPLLGTASLDYNEAEDLGYFKFDFLNNSVYKDIETPEELDELLNTEPTWELLQHKEIVENLVHIHNYLDILQTMKPTSIEQLAMVLAMIRPAKKHLVGKDWKEVEKHIWVKPTNDEYYFKRSHAIAYAMSIIVQLNKLVKDL